jgi:3-methyladenine DNA glycosylase Tag
MAIEKFEHVRQRAEERKGGRRALAALLPDVLGPAQLAAKGDDRYLSMICRVVNQAGFNWSVIDHKWPEFEAAFFKFNLRKLAGLSPAQWEAYTQDVRVVRNWQKIKALRDNVQFVQQEAARHGTFGRFLADWPADDQIGLMAYLKNHAARLGGFSAQWFLRNVGKDAFMLTPDVVRALQNAGVDIRANPTGKTDLRRVQDAFNAWHRETRLPYAHLSKIAAYSIGENYDAVQLAEEMKTLRTRL